ncbi:MAG: Uma2 family endonuclease, partial [Candidatus Tectomicrobia bacterium]|nr:Uma2 family endonuclease [Candidatus Tectomicrobia bacterium]
LSMVQDKMHEYMENGAQLGWLIDPKERRVYVYRPGQPKECLENPETIAGDPLLNGFILDVHDVW